MRIDAIKILDEREARAFAPPVTDYASATPSWAETEFRHFDGAASHVVVGYWKGDPGVVKLDPWPYTEVCSIITGRVAVRDLDGGLIEFGAGEAFMVPKGFIGDWVTLEPSTKIFIAIS